MDLDDERLAKARDIYDTFIMKDLLSQAHVRIERRIN